MNDKALLDASVLVPISLCDILLRTAEAGLFQPRWTDEILRETRRGVARRLIRRGLAPEDFMESIDRRIGDMQRAFRRATVTGWEPLVDRLTLPDPDDRHVLAAAMRSGSTVIVTQNVRHFPTAALPAALRGPRCGRLSRRPAGQLPVGYPRLCSRPGGRDRKYGKADNDLATVLARLASDVPGFVARVRESVAEWPDGSQPE